jgi:hypothetical protein
MKQRIEKRRPKNRTELREEIFDCWNKISKETIINCIEKLNQVMKIVISKDGDFVKEI